MDCGLPEFKGEGAEEVYKTLAFTEYPSTREKREKRLKEFSEKMKRFDSDIPFNTDVKKSKWLSKYIQRAINSTVE